MFAIANGLQTVTAGLSGVVLLAAPVHLFFHMRGAYGTSILGTLLRMFLLFNASLVGAVLIIMGLVWVGLSGMA